MMNTKQTLIKTEYQQPRKHMSYEQTSADHSSVENRKAVQCNFVY